MYNLEQYKELAKRFSEKSFLGKLMIIKQNPEIFILEVDEDGNFFLRLTDEKMMEQEVDMLFSFPQNFGKKEYKDMFNLIDITIKTV